MSENFTIRIAPELREKLEIKAHQEQMSLTEFIRTHLEHTSDENSPGAHLISDEVLNQIKTMRQEIKQINNVNGFEIREAIVDLKLFLEQTKTKIDLKPVEDGLGEVLPIVKTENGLV